jgi:hypothetical protein
MNLKLIPFGLLLISSCTSPETQPLDYKFYGGNENLTYNSVSTLKIGYNQEALAPNTNFRWTSGNEQVVSVKDGVISARKIGEAVITAAPQQGTPLTILVNVKPMYNTYREPIANFTLTKHLVKNMTETRELLNETENTVTYKGENSKVSRVAYGFENGKLASVEVLLAAGSNGPAEAETFLKERYPDAVTVNGVKGFLNEEHTCRIVLLGSATEGYRVVYTENK